jgi:hypothetical protein
MPVTNRRQITSVPREDAGNRQLQEERIGMPKAPFVRGREPNRISQMATWQLARHESQHGKLLLADGSHLPFAPTILQRHQ